MKNINYQGIPNCLKKYRRARGPNQKEVAEILELNSTSMISRWEKGVCLPKPLNIFKLAVLYRTMVDALSIGLLRAMRNDVRKKEKGILKAKKKVKG